MLGIPIVTQFNGTGVKKAIASFKQLDSTAAKVKFALKATAVASVAAFAAVGAAAFAAGKQFLAFAQMARDDEKAALQLASSIRASTKATDQQIASVEQWIDTVQRATGVADDELRPAYARIIRSTKDFDKAQRLLKVALDVSAATGKPLKAVTEGLTKAYDGNIKALMRLGLGFSKTDLQTTSYVKVQKKVKEGTDGVEKAQYKAITTARSFDSVLVDLEKRFSGAALDKANTYEGVMARFAITVDELKESLGMVLLPYLKKLAEYGIRIADAFGKKGVAGAFAEMKYILQTLLYDADGNLNAVGRTINDLINKFNQLGKAFNLGMGVIDVISGNMLVRTTGQLLGSPIQGFNLPSAGQIGGLNTSINPGSLRTIRGQQSGTTVIVNAGIGDPVQIGRQVYNTLNTFERRNGGR